MLFSRHSNQRLRSRSQGAGLASSHAGLSRFDAESTLFLRGTLAPTELIVPPTSSPVHISADIACPTHLAMSARYLLSAFLSPLRQDNARKNELQDVTLRASYPTQRVSFTRRAHRRYATDRQLSLYPRQANTHILSPKTRRTPDHSRWGSPIWS